jgi:hypothetical protein
MILDKRPRALIFAFFCLAAALGGGARAAQVYPGCAVPPATSTGKIWWVDPVNGKTPAAGGLGTQAAPWDSLNGVISGSWGTAGYSAPGYTRPLLSSVPYFHFAGGKRVDVADDLGSPPVHPGDTIELMSGNYGDIGLGNYMLPLVNSDWITIEAARGQTPVFSTLYIRSTNKWVFKGVKVQSVYRVPVNSGALVTIGDQGAAYPTTDIIFDSMQLSSVDDASTWTKAQWGQARSGLRALGSPGAGTNGEPYTTCISMTGSHIQNVRTGAVLAANNLLFSHNELDHFGDDGIDYAANNFAITHNYIHDNFDAGDGNHEDAMQGQIGPILRGVVPYNAFSNILIDSNLVIRQTDPKLAFPTYLQGIDAFDEDWTNLTVTNNVVVTSACWGIGYASVHGGKIINNTVVDDGTDAGTKNPAGKVVCRPNTTVGDKTHEGPSSNDVIIRNNIASGLNIYSGDPTITMDHNICLQIKGNCPIVTYVGGKQKGVYKPGEYADHNVVERNGAAGMFVSFDPAKFVYDLRLRPGALAIGAGNSAEAPPRDITGASRGSSIDVGAYQHSPGK